MQPLQEFVFRNKRFICKEKQSLLKTEIKKRHALSKKAYDRRS